MIRKLTLFFIAILICQQTAGLSAAQLHINNVKNSMDSDYELVCTGQNMLWISISQSLEAGYFVEVELAEESDILDIDRLCPQFDARDFEAHHLATAIDWLISWKAISTIRFKQVSADLLKQKFNLAFQRGPPSF